ncbi:MAG TPA: hypothetical protein VN281_08405 [Verrucomicrobiae bacterium]|nr:hypothetical protein [Verrucomicrobiae bacterium]
MDRLGLSKSERLAKLGCMALLLGVPACIGCAMLLTMLRDRLSAVFVVGFLILVAVSAFRPRRSAMIAGVNQSPSDRKEQKRLGQVMDTGRQAVQGITVAVDVLPEKPDAQKQADSSKSSGPPGAGSPSEFGQQSPQETGDKNPGDSERS